MRIKNIDVSLNNEINVVDVEIEYPRSNEVNTLEIGLTEVRASDNIRIKYDFERDGWTILQPRLYHPKIDENSYDYAEEWIESAFCPAWQYELEEEEKFKYQPKTK